MKIGMIFLACLALTVISCAPESSKKPKSRKKASARPAHRWGLMDSAKNVQQKQNRAVKRQDKFLEDFAGKQE